MGAREYMVLLFLGVHLVRALSPCFSHEIQLSGFRTAGTTILHSNGEYVLPLMIILDVEDINTDLQSPLERISTRALSDQRVTTRS